ncbi:hypothetical protein SAMN05720761_103107 [Fibrobacter sp. UWCM]|uniref:hypothetical protein n=1 Tax=Fibrobacter sp. UWCM TaxID=1896208 RepID=UPI0009106133|nr:hypothetical protein [Fibrobacter sp. UWCM]SHG58614.1 hypothetical protein SAMN05720761_103107 [Fibrobacter sp. UWCM]
MKIERKKVESVGEFSPKTKATLAALLGLSAALSVPAEPQGSDAVIPTPPTDSTNAITQDSTVSLEKDSTSSESGNYDWSESPLGGIMEDSYDEELTDEEIINNAIDAALERNYFRR